MLSAFFIGLAGSLHCVGMCGPLVMALPMAQAAEKRRMWAMALLYQSGRTLMYASLGLLFGLLGKGMALAGFQKIFSLAAGVLLLVMVLFTLPLEFPIKFPFLSKFNAFVQKSIAFQLRNRPIFSTFTLGVLNGLLPCGLVYIALAGALSSTNSALDGFIYMLNFGLGTLPALMGVSLLGLSRQGLWRQKLRLAQPFLLAIAGILLLNRGLNLDLSLFESAVPPAGFECH